jgi:Reverse transcriptase (RNA-dependent DNA polymerase)
MSEESQALTSFTCDKGTFCLRVVPFGLKNALSIFQRYMEQISGELRIENIAFYLNDILIGNMTDERHKIDVNRVVSQLLKPQLRGSAKKCQWGKHEIEFLGHKISSTSLKILD